MNLDLNRPRDLGKILDDSFAFYRAHWRTLLLLAFVVVVPVYVAVYGVGLGWLWEGYDVRSGDTVKLADVLESLSGTAAQLLVVTPLVTAMTLHVVRAAASGAPVRAGEALRAGLDVFGTLFVAVLLVAGGVLLGLLALIVPGLILAVRWILVSQVVVLEGEKGTAALGRSFELTRGHAWFTFLVVLVVNLLVSVLTAIVLIPLELAADSADTMALSLLGQTLGALFSLPIVTVAYTLLYYSLRTQEQGAPSAPAATPEPEPQAQPPQADTLPGVPGTFGGGFKPPSAG